MQPLQRHLLSSDDDKVPAEFIWQSNFPRGDLEQIFFFFFKSSSSRGRTHERSAVLPAKLWPWKKKKTHRLRRVQSGRSLRRERFSGVVRVFAVDLGAGGGGGWKRWR